MMNPSSMDPLQSTGASNFFNSARDNAQAAAMSTSGEKESRTQKLERIKSQVASGTYSPNLQSLANKLLQGGHLKD